MKSRVGQVHLAFEVEGMAILTRCGRWREPINRTSDIDRVTCKHCLNHADSRPYRDLDIASYRVRGIKD